MYLITEVRKNIVWKGVSIDKCRLVMVYVIVLV